MKNAKLIVFAIFLFGLAAQARAADDGFMATLSAEYLHDDAMQIGLSLTNHTGRNLCFFFYDSYPELLTRTGEPLDVGLPGVEIGIHTRPNDVKVIWEGDTAYFNPSVGINRPFVSSASLQNVAQVKYDLAVYDCADMFSRPYMETAPLFRRALTAVPIDGCSKAAAQIAGAGKSPVGPADVQNWKVRLGCHFGN